MVAAGLYEHPSGTELRVYVEPEGCDVVLLTETHSFDVIWLEQKAITFCDMLHRKGWSPLTIT